MQLSYYAWSALLEKLSSTYLVKPICLKDSVKELLTQVRLLC